MSDLTSHVRRTDLVVAIAKGTGLRRRTAGIALAAVLATFVVAPTTAEAEERWEERWTATEVVSVATDGTAGNGDTRWPLAASDDLSVVAFSSMANNLQPGAPVLAGEANLYLRDRTAGTTTWLNGHTQHVDVHPSGRQVLYVESSSTDVVLRDTVTAERRVLHAPRWSASYSTVRFAANGDQVLFAAGSGHTLVDLATGAEEPLFGTLGEPGTDDVLLSDDTDLVAFSSNRGDLVPDDTNGTRDVFVYDRRAGEVTVISASAVGGTTANGASTLQGLSPDGRHLVFHSTATDIVPGAPARSHFLHDRLDGTTTRLPVHSDVLEIGDGAGWLLTAGGRLHDLDAGTSVSVQGDEHGDETSALFASLVLNDQRTEALSLANDGLLTGDTNARVDLIHTERRLVDVTPPRTTITWGPPASGLDGDVTVQFEVSRDDVRTSCTLLDQVADEQLSSTDDCTSPLALGPLEPGSYLLEISSWQDAGPWLVEADAPTVAFVVLPHEPESTPDTFLAFAPSGADNPRSGLRFGFYASAPDASFECRLNGGPWLRCTSPYTLSGLDDGRYTGEVRAIDRHGNVDATPATAKWTVGPEAPVGIRFTATPDELSTRDVASFGFAADEPFTSFECRLDEGVWSACTSPHEVTGLQEGSHTFAVRSSDRFGSADPEPVSHRWTVDTTPPVATITSGPTALTNDPVATFAFTSSEENVTFECRLDGGSFEHCATPFRYRELSDGTYSLEVRAHDAAGNIGPTSSLWRWRIDTTPPVSRITSGPSGTSSSSTASFAFTANETGSRFQCRLGTQAWTACTSPVTYRQLADGKHTFRVRATDPAGNVESGPPSRTWTVAASASGPVLSDIGGNVHAAAIRKVAAAGITTGYPDGTFRPDGTVTRAQMATFLQRALELPPGSARFSDVGNHTHAAGIGAVARARITEGYPDGTFRPNDTVTRAQMASFLVRALDL